MRRLRARPRSSGAAAGDLGPLAVRLRKDLGDTLRAGHPWVYRDALDVPERAPEPATGEVVELTDRHGSFVGRGLYQRGSPIAVRVYCTDPGEALDEALLRRRLASALRSRRGLFLRAETDAFRLCHGEGDFLPGVVIDLYAAVAVVQFDYEAAAARFRLALPAALAEVGLDLLTVYERGRGHAQLLAGDDPPDEVEVREHGVTLLVNVKHGQKTGFFLDMRDNRRLLRGCAGGLSVWNGFSYTGGFSVQAALGGATRVVSVDQAAPALDTARRIFQRNGLDPAAHGFFAEDVFAHLRQAIAAGQRYGLVIVDPPSFAPSEEALRRALRAYRDLYALALNIVEEGGLFAAGSCSSHVDQAAFLQVLGAAAQHAGRRLRLLEVRGQPPDHPSLPAFPEGRYLKFALARLD